MGSNFGDLNKDGFPDFYLSTGSPQFNNIYPNKMYLTIDGKMVEDVSYSGGFGHLQKGHAVAFADLDNDGDQDVYNVIGGAYPGDNFNNALFVNPGNNNNFLYVTLEGKTTNKAAIGSKIEVFSKDSSGKKKVSRKVVNCGGSFGCSPIKRQEIGLGTSNSIDSVRIHWANKNHQIQTIKDVEPNTWIKISELESSVEKLNLKNPT
ncbi:MAG: CRTAC1 family protein [Saprospiraceae bacterium]